MKIPRISFFRWYFTRSQSVRHFWREKKQFFNNQNSRIWGCVGESVEIVVKVHCGTALGDEFAAMLKMRPPEQSHNALWNHLDPVSRVRDLGETFSKFRIVNSCYTYHKNWNQFFLKFQVIYTLMYLLSDLGDYLFEWLNLDIQLL